MTHKLKASYDKDKAARALAHQHIMERQRTEAAAASNADAEADADGEAAPAAKRMRTEAQADVLGALFDIVEHRPQPRASLASSCNNNNSSRSGAEQKRIVSRADGEEDDDGELQLVPDHALGSAPRVSSSGASSGSGRAAFLRASSGGVGAPAGDGAGAGAAWLTSGVMDPLALARRMPSSAGGGAPQRIPLQPVGAAGAGSGPRIGGAAGRAAFAGASSAPLRDHNLTFAEKQRQEALQKTMLVKEQVRIAGIQPKPVGPADSSSSSSSSSNTYGGGSFSSRAGATPQSGGRLGGTTSSGGGGVGARGFAGAVTAAKPAGKLRTAAGGLSDEALQRMLAAESSHADEAAAAVLDRSREHADHLEKLEAMESKMRDVTSTERTAWCCMDCEQWFDKSPTMCVKEGHEVVQRKRKQWAFKCGHCGQRTFDTKAVCAKECANCAHRDWQATSVYRLRGESAKAAAAVAGTHVAPVLEVRAQGAHGNDLVTNGGASFAQAWGDAPASPGP
jgi:hypothetical protein